MNKIVATTAVVLLCVISFGIGHSLAMRAAAEMILDNAKAMAIWRESDWTVSSIRYAKMIQLIQTERYATAIDQACQAIAGDLKNIREISNVTDDGSAAPRVPQISEQTYATSCK